MKLRLILLTVLLTTAFGVSGQEKPSQLANGSGDEGLVKVSIMYPYADGNTFDMVYYETKHMPMVAGYLGSNLVKYTIEKGMASGIPDTPLPYMAIGTFYIKDLDEYKAAIAPNRETIRSDFPNYTNIRPIILVSEVLH